MAKLTDKPLYVAGSGVQFLVSWCAMGNRQINVANGKEKGSDLSGLQTPQDQGPDSVYLDNRTGDFYQKSSTANWEVLGNVGLHLARALDSKETRANKTPQRFLYAQTSSGQSFPVMGPADCKCHIATQMMGHLLCKDIP